MKAKVWDTAKIGDVCTVIAGQSPEGKYYNERGNGLPFYQGKKEFTEKYLGEPTTWTTETTKVAIKGDVLMSVRAPVGPVNFSTQKICIGRGLAAIRASDEIDREFLFSFLVKHESQLVGNAGAVFNSINKTQIEEIELPLPPLPEQHRIVSILDQAFAAIDKAKANAEQNLKNARELFESYLQGVFEKRGEGWEEKTIQEVCEEIFAGGDAPDNFSKEKDKKNTIPIFANAVKDKGLYGYTNSARVIQPSISISARGSGTGHTEIRYEHYLPIVRLIVLIPNLSLVTLEFLKHSIDNLEILRSGSAIPQLTVPMIREYRIPFPPIKEQHIIVQKLDSLSVQAMKLEKVYYQKLNDLEELKRSILQKAFSGELKTSKAVLA